jgi:hypothetical protein
MRHRARKTAGAPNAEHDQVRVPFLRNFQDVFGGRTQLHYKPRFAPQFRFRGKKAAQAMLCSVHEFRGAHQITALIIRNHVHKRQVRLELLCD